MFTTRAPSSALALRALELWRAEPNHMEGLALPDPPESGLLTGETGILLVACTLGHRLEDDLRARISPTRQRI